MQQTEKDEFKHIVSSVKEMYGIDNLVEEALAWYDVQKHKPLGDNSLGMIELVKQTTLFPAVPILITMTLPAISCTVERSFSTLRRMKTWFRSTMSDTRLSGLCIVSVQILHGVDPLSYFSFQPVLHDWCNKGRGMCYPVCGMVHIKEPLLLIDKSSLCGGSGFPFSLSEWSLTIYLTPYNRR